MTPVDSRTILRAPARRQDGYYDPDLSEFFSHEDGSRVELRLDQPGFWLVGFQAFVRSESGATSVEVDVAADLGNGEEPEYPACASIVAPADGDGWLHAVGALVVAQPVTLWAYLYGHSPGASVHALQPQHQRPGLFAWPLA